jgi:hypothetical protein
MQGCAGEGARKKGTGSSGVAAGLRQHRKSAEARAALATTLHNVAAAAYNACDDYRTSIMLTRVLRAALPAFLASAFGLQPAHADIYTWVDASGSINVSNVAPPDGVRVSKVTHESAPADAAREAARLAEVQALAERVRQLEDEVAFARRPMPPPMEYRTPPAPPVVQYFFNAAPSPAQYPVDMAPEANTGCDPTWMGCGFGWNPGFYPPSFVVVPAVNFRRFPGGRGGHHFAVQQPVRAPGGMRRG